MYKSPIDALDDVLPTYAVRLVEVRGEWFVTTNIREPHGGRFRVPVAGPLFDVAEVFESIAGRIERETGLYFQRRVPQQPLQGWAP